MGCGHYVKDEITTKKGKFAVKIGQCASIEEVIGTLAIEEINGNYALSVVSKWGKNHALHEFVPQCLINKKVRARWDGKSLIIEEKK